MNLKPGQSINDLLVKSVMPLSKSKYKYIGAQLIGSKQEKMVHALSGHIALCGKKPGVDGGRGWRMHSGKGLVVDCPDCVKRIKKQ